MTKKVLMLISILVFCTTVAGLDEPAGGVTLPFEDGFENIAVGVHPAQNGWQTMFSGKSAYVSDVVAHNGNLSFRLDSSPNWARFEYVLLDDIPDQLTYEVSVCLDPTEGKGAYVGFAQKVSCSGGYLNCGATWNRFSISGQNGVFFSGAPGVNVYCGSYTPGTWCTVKADLDFINLTADIWYDGVQIAENVSIRPKEWNNTQYPYKMVSNKWTVVSTNYSPTTGSSNVVYFDDVRIYETPEVQVEVLSGVPEYLWNYGCVPTCGGMVIAYWDGMEPYKNLVEGDLPSYDEADNGHAEERVLAIYPGGTRPVDDFNIVDNLIASYEHARDFWNGKDSWIDHNPLGHYPPNCLADFMGSNMSARICKDGMTFAFFADDGLQGYAAWRGYTSDCDWIESTSLSNLYNILKNEIDLGRPTILHGDVPVMGGGHAVVVYGYQDSEGGDDWIAVRDTWIPGGEKGPGIESILDINGIEWWKWENTGFLPKSITTFAPHQQVDTDGDGINDYIENATGTDPFDDDTDNDGLLDGPGSGEDTNANGVVDPGETDPRSSDTDGDGIQDGTEGGLVIPEGLNTDLTVFVPDSDPFTTTDPTNPDTDGDGLLDGDEDLNGNGAIDPGEWNPNVITGFIDFEPNTLNLKNQGKWITCYIELPEGYNVDDINVSKILLDEQVPAELRPTEIGDNDDDGIPDFMVKFDRSAIQEILEVGNAVEITVTGELTDGTPFEGIDTIRVIEKGGKK